jgi:hypothetical protein
VVENEKFKLEKETVDAQTHVVGNRNRVACSSNFSALWYWFLRSETLPKEGCVRRWRS